MITLPPASPRRFEATHRSRHSRRIDADCQRPESRTTAPTMSRTPTSHRGDLTCLTPLSQTSKLLAPMWLRCGRHRPRLPSFW